MSAASEADLFMLDAIRRGEADAWTQLVEQYQGRLLAYVQPRLPASTEAEDIVQDVFIAFLRGLDRFRGDASIETYLFTILRRKIIDIFRSAKVSGIPLDDSVLTALRGSDQTASWYVRRDEDTQRIKHVLLDALRELIEGYKASLSFEKLMIIEMIFICLRRNKDIATTLGITEQRVSMVKRRTITRLRAMVAERLDGRDTSDEFYQFDDDVLRELWHDYRLSCPKRSTIGGYVLNTLDEHWQVYVDFHLNIADCAFCQANRDDLDRQTQQADLQILRQRVLNSTVGFLRTQK